MCVCGRVRYDPDLLKIILVLGIRVLVSMEYLKTLYIYIVWWMVKFDIMNIRKVFPVEGFRYKIFVYSVYEPLINFCIA